MGPSLSRLRSILKRIRRRCATAAWRALGAGAAMACAATSAGAHGFGQRFDLPLPLSLYLFGAGAAVALSFVVFGLFVRHPPKLRDIPRLDLTATPLGRLIASPIVVVPLKLITLGLFAVTIAAGLLGDQNPYRNIAPTLVWIVWWVGFAYVSALLGNVWASINPWRTVFDAANWVWRRLGGRGDRSFQWPYPRALGVWPACLLLLAFSWIELVYPSPAVPAQIACFAIAYSILTWAGMLTFGRDTWLEHGEVFTIVFGLFARVSPIETRGSQLLIRPFGAGLLGGQPVSISMMALVLLLLATVLYDGLLTTPEWTNFENTLRLLLSWPGERGATAIRTLGLLALWLMFLGIYGAVSALMTLAAGQRRSALEMARSFALTLIPIAIGYHVAHYLAFLLIQGQYIVPLLSDPFGYGWNLFGTAEYRVDIGLVGARFAWYAAVLAIVLGHVAAVYLAHVKAIQTIEVRAAALRSQIPLTALMVAYTLTGLSIIAEPIVERRTPAKPSATAGVAIGIPADALLPEPGTGQLRPVGAAKLAQQKLTYRVLGSAFHDGSRTEVADLLYAYAFAYRWGVRRDGDDLHYDPWVDAATAPMRRSVAGLQVVGADETSKTFRVGDVSFVRQLYSIDVYTGVVSEDADRHAGAVAPWSTIPWHLLVLMEEAVGRGWAAFSQAEATRRGVPWLDLVRSEPLNLKLTALVDQFARDGHRPEALRALVNQDEARKRWAALAAFYKSSGHFLVTNGPYRLKRWSADGVTVEAFRDLSYPLGVGSYDAYANPRRGYVTDAKLTADRITLSGDIEIVEKFQRSHRLARVPLQSIGAEIRKRLAPECRYVVIDQQQRIVLAGVARLVDAPTFQININGLLPHGSYTMLAIVALNGNVMNADIRRIPFVISSNP